jgi:hypothetical protein
MNLTVRCVGLLCIITGAVFAQYDFDFTCTDDTIQSGTDLIEFHFRLENTGSLPDSYAVECRIVDSVPGWFEIFCAGGGCAEPGDILFDYLQVGAVDSLVKISVWPTSGYAVEILNLLVRSVAQPALRDSINVYAVSEASIEETEVPGHLCPFIAVNPNPAKKACQVMYYIERNSRVKISLIDPYGSTVMRSIEENACPGLHKIVLNTSHLAQGVYFLKVDTGEGYNTEKIIIFR